VSTAAAEAVSPPKVSERAAFAVETTQKPGLSIAEKAVPMRPQPAPARDKLQRISGIDAGIEDLLSEAGVTRYSQIAQWAPADVQRFDKEVGASGRIARENWVEQAQILSRCGDTAYSREFDRSHDADASPLLPAKLADAIRENAAKLQEAARRDPEPGPEDASRVGSHNRVVRSATAEDLKRIRGIGVLIERRLNSMGVTSYEQIANWTAADIERVSQTLDFKGRIERENWVEQARILASGGTTEFSRRVDRGEVETSRART
jgi:predicted flap endonuclease-1-like 5' DNA nuclease